VANLWPKSTKAVRSQEKSNWDIGNALIEECGPPSENGVNNDSLANIKQFCEFLFSAYGIERTVSTLREVRDVCYVFQGAGQPAPVSWTIYCIFRGNPDLLLNWIAEHPEEGMSKKDAKLMLAAAQVITDHTDSDAAEDEEQEEEEEEATGTAADAVEQPEAPQDDPVPMAAADGTVDQDGANEEQTQVDEGEEVPVEAQPETEEDAEVKRNKAKEKREAEMQQKVRDFKALAAEIGRFVEEEDPSVPWMRQANETIKIIAKQISWFTRVAKKRDAYQDSSDIKRPQIQESDGIVIQGRFPPAPNAKGSELVQ
jgi:hypothetical protein